MAESRFAPALKFRDDALGQLLPQLDSPLVERVDAPDAALGKHAVLVERHQFPQRLRREPLGQDGVGRPVPSNTRWGTSQSGVPSLATYSTVLPKAAILSSTACTSRGPRPRRPRGWMPPSARAGPRAAPHGFR